ncbi:MAG TPA: hypothetical protein VFM05_12985, partial [Candidatus Saccharimonadales bacterium]|nr:hypothetical protein [Candidatus Saccharimonadales bacterium]
LNASVYLDRQKVAAKIRCATVSRTAAWIAIGQPLLNTTIDRSDTNGAAVSCNSFFRLQIVH